MQRGRRRQWALVELILALTRLGKILRNILRANAWQNCLINSSWVSWWQLHLDNGKSSVEGICVQGSESFCTTRSGSCSLQCESFSKPLLWSGTYLQIHWNAKLNLQRNENSNISIWAEEKKIDLCDSVHDKQKTIGPLSVANAGTTGPCLVESREEFRPSTSLFFLWNSLDPFKCGGNQHTRHIFIHVLVSSDTF